MAAQDVALKHGKFFDAAIDGRLFHAATPAAGVAPGTAIGTTAAFSLHNPLGSGLNVAIMVVSMGYISGTLGAGTVWHLINDEPTAAAPTGTAIVEEAGVVDDENPVPFGLTTATLAAAPKIIRPFCSLTALLASTAAAPWPCKDEVQGAIVLSPGCTYSLHATAAAGSTPLVAFGVTFECIPLGAD